MASSLSAAASEILGTNFEKFDEYFKVYSARVDGVLCIAVVEKVTGQDTMIALDIKKLEEEDSDEFYYSRLKGLAKLVDPFIPDEEKHIPVDNWPEPKWQPPEEA